ncbi:MAG: carboxypeptidase-like regulatory domain-containing protein [Turneriella sp.]|nr:carboxypeptidase-like regulatory domain-containing protein [Turneriella sp.]
MRGDKILFNLFTLWAGFATWVWSALPKTDVVLEMQDGTLLHSEFVAENDKSIIVDIRAAIMPTSLCENKNWPQYLPKNRLGNPQKLNTGHCRFIGKPFVARSVTLVPSDIKKRYDTTLLVLSASGEKRQLPFFDATENLVRGFDFTVEPPAAKGTTTQPGIRSFSLDTLVETIQTVDSSGKRTILYPKVNFFHQWSRWDPRLGVYYTPLLPTGDIGQLRLGVLGFTVENSVSFSELKFLQGLKKSNLRLRGGINVGFHRFSQELSQNNLAVGDGSITLLPVMVQFGLFLDSRPKAWKLTLSPFLRIGNGIIFSSVQTQLRPQYVGLLAPGAEAARSGNFTGYGFSANIGIEVRPDGWPLAFVADSGYLFHAQDPSGQYISFNAGVVWHYGTKAPEPKILPIQYVGGKSVVLSLKGTVKKPDTTPVAGASLKLRAKGSPTVIRDVMSDEKGNYSMEVEPGLEYVIEVSKAGFANAQMELPLLTNDKKTLNQDFTLNPL